MTLANRRRACGRLAAIARTLARLRCDKLRELKADAQRHMDEPDFVWLALLRSFSTWGNSRGYEGLFGPPYNYKRITFEALLGRSPKDRLCRLSETLTASKVRMAEKKARFLAENFDTIDAMGGLAEAERKLDNQKTREDMMAFMRQFRGIGEKYARDVFMDVYHPKFRQSIAFDTRLQSIAEKLGLSLRPYPEGEEFYLSVAKKAGLSGWELDRLLYKFEDEVLTRLRGGARSKTTKRMSASVAGEDRKPKLASNRLVKNIKNRRES